MGSPMGPTAYMHRRHRILAPTPISTAHPTAVDPIAVDSTVEVFMVEAMAEAMEDADKAITGLSRQVKADWSRSCGAILRNGFMLKSSPDISAKRIRVLIADDHPVVRLGLSTILTSEDDLKIVAEAVDGEETCALCDKLCPDVLLLDLRMPKKDGLQVLFELMARDAPKPQVVVMTCQDTEENIRQSVKAGAKAFLVKGAKPQVVREAVRRVAKGESFLPPAIRSKLTEWMGYRQLSQRENQVLQGLGLGKTNKEIAEALCIGEGTVKHHVKSILRKLNAIGRAEAVAIAIRRGLLSVG
jgi:two-component system NarL family response regulator